MTKTINVKQVNNLTLGLYPFVVSTVEPSKIICQLVLLINTIAHPFIKKKTNVTS